jgi:hypothetical protein
MRAVWVATVANIDWPSRPGLTTEQQKAEALAILDKVKIPQYERSYFAGKTTGRCNLSFRT